MYNYPQTYSYYVNENPYLYNPELMTRNSQGEHQLLEDIITGMKKEATTIDFLSRLANYAPNDNHKQNILLAIDSEQRQLKNFTDLYTNLTGQQPMYQIEPITFQNYSDGLQKAYNLGVGNCEEYRISCLNAQYPLVREVFLHAFTSEKENAIRFSHLNQQHSSERKDYGSQPYVVNIEEATKQNNNYRTALWTGRHLQVTLMSIKVGDDIGLEVHPTTDQFLRIEQGQGVVEMGDTKDNLNFRVNAYEDYAIMVPAGKWHNVTNTGNTPLKLYAIYAPPEHPFGTVHETKEIAMASERNKYNY